LIFITFALPVISQQQAIPYTMADRDRLIQVEAQVNSLNQRFDDMNKRFDDMNNRFDDMNNRLDRLEDKFDTYFTWGFGLVLGAIFARCYFCTYGFCYLGQKNNIVASCTTARKDITRLKRNE